MMSHVHFAEIPLFHVITAKVSFTNINGHTSPASHVSLSTERKRAEPAPVHTPMPSSPTEVGGVKRRHGQAGGATSSSVDPPTCTRGSWTEGERLVSPPPQPSVYQNLAFFENFKWPVSHFYQKTVVYSNQNLSFFLKWACGSFLVKNHGLL